MIRQLLILSLLAVLAVSMTAWGQTGAAGENPTTVTCPKCGYENDWDNKFCTVCGAPLEEAKQARRAMVRQRPATLEVGMSRLFHLRDNNVVNGIVVDIAGDSMAVIESPDGVLRIPTWEILDEMVDLTKHDGTQFAGPVLSEDDYSTSVKTPYGVVVVLKRDIMTMERYYGDKRITWQEEKRRFLSAEELTDILSDPTAFPLQERNIYLSGLDLGYGFTEHFTLRTQFGHNFMGDLNLHPKFRIYHRATGSSDLSLSLGIKMFSNHLMRSEALRCSHWIIDTTGVGWRDVNKKRLDASGATEVPDVMLNKDAKEFFGSTYLVLSRRQSMASGRGKWGWHLGAATNSLPLSKPKLKPGYQWDEEFAFTYRVWAAMDYDLSKKLKFLIEVFADNGNKYLPLKKTWETYAEDSTPFTIDSQEGDYKPVDFDFGFLWTVSRSLRLGLHFQTPYLIFYFKW